MRRDEKWGQQSDESRFDSPTWKSSTVAAALSSIHSLPTCDHNCNLTLIQTAHFCEILEALRIASIDSPLFAFMEKIHRHSDVHPTATLTIPLAPVARADCLWSLAGSQHPRKEDARCCVKHTTAPLSPRQIDAKLPFIFNLLCNLLCTRPLHALLGAAVALSRGLRVNALA